MGVAQKIEDPFDTLWLLQMKYRKPVVAIEELLPDYLPHLSLKILKKLNTSMRWRDGYSKR